MNDESKFYLIISLNQLLESKSIILGENNQRSKALSAKIGQLLESIPALETFLDEKDQIIRKKIYAEIGRYIQFEKYEKGFTIKHSGEGDKMFYMVFYGKVLKLNIIYKTLYASFKEYILYLAKLLIINEKHLYIDCLKKNQKIFKIKETIDIMTYGKNIKGFDFQEEVEKIKKLHDEIFLVNVPEEEKIKRKLNIQELLSLYNPHIKEKNNYLNVEQKFSVNLPFFYVDRILDPISFIGDLNKNHGIKTYSTYICLNNCDIYYINKTEIYDRVLFSHINSNKGDIITNVLFKKHYLFKDVDIKFLKKNYSKFFSIIKVKKDEKFILQNSVYDGVYIIGKGILELSTKRSYNELNELKYNIMNNTSNIINTNLDSFRDKKRDEIIQRLLRNPQFIKEANEIKDINFGTLVDTEIVGLCDLYDKNNGIYNFNVKCISNGAELFFVPKEIFNSLLTNPDIEEKITKITVEKIKILKLKIKRFTDLFEEKFDELSPKKEEKKFLNINNLSLSKNLFNKLKISTKIIPKRFQYDFTRNKSKQRKLIKSKSDSTIFNSKISNHNSFINNNPEMILDRFIKYNKKYNNNIYKNIDQINFTTSTNKNITSLQNISNISNESKFEEINSIKKLYSRRVNNLLLNNNKFKNKHNPYYSVSLVNQKPKSKDNKILLDIINNMNINRQKNIFNKQTPSNYIKQYSELGRNRKAKKLLNIFPNNYTTKRKDETLIMPILNNKYRKSNSTFQYM